LVFLPGKIIAGKYFTGDSYAGCLGIDVYAKQPALIILNIVYPK
jgi:hypothetical protein